MSHFGQPIEVVPPTARVGHPTGADDSRTAIASRGQPLQRDPAPFGRHTTGLHAACGQVHPRVLIRRKLVVGHDNIIAPLPRKPLGHQGNASRGIGNQGDLVRLGADQPSSPLTSLLDLSHPTRVKGVAVARRVLSPLSQRSLGRTAQRRDRRMIEIGPTFGDGHFATKPSPTTPLWRSAFRLFRQFFIPRCVGLGIARAGPIA